MDVSERTRARYASILICGTLTVRQVSRRDIPRAAQQQFEADALRRGHGFVTIEKERFPLATLSFSKDYELWEG